MPPEGWPFFGAEPPARPIDILLRERTLDLWNFIDRIVPDPATIKLRKIVRLGTLRKEIIAVAREEAIDLIVLEPHNRFLFSNLISSLFRCYWRHPLATRNQNRDGECWPFFRSRAKARSRAGEF